MEAGAGRPPWPDAAGRASLVLLAADRGRLCQPDADRFARPIWSPAARRAAACRARRGSRHAARAHRADRRAGRAARPGARLGRAGPRRARGSTGSSAPSATASMSRSSATASRASASSSRSCSTSPIARGVPLVATNEPYFASAVDYEAHDALICIAEGAVVSDTRSPAADAGAPLQDPRRDGRALRRPAGGDAPTPSRSPCAAPSGRAPASRSCRASRRGDGDVRSTRSAKAAAPRPQARGWRPRLAAHGTAPGLSEEDYRERLDFELDVIERMKFPGYFLIVADFIKWAKAQGIPVGPGRGSGAGSLVAYALTITDLDPLRFGLLFERFLNPERVSMPDFDIDFCQDRRDEVIRYVRGRVRRTTASRRSSPSARSWRAACCATSAACCEMPLRPGRQAGQARAAEPGQPGDAGPGDRGRAAPAGGDRPRTRRARGCSTSPRSSRASTRNASTHAAGIVIGDRPLDRARAALPRSEVRHAGDPVQHEVGRAGGPGEVRLPGPEDADRADRPPSTS